MKSWVCRQAEWLIIGGCLLLIAVYALCEKGQLP